MRKRLQTSIVVLLASSLLQVMVTPMCAAAETLHYWRFEDGPGFLEDSVGGATLTAQNFDQVPLPSDGRGQNFPHDLPGIGSNESAADTPPGTAGLTSSRTTRIDDAFTIELFANIDDLSIDSLRSVLAAQATNCCNTSNFGWAFTVEIRGNTNNSIFNAIWNSRPHELELFASDGQSIQLIPSGILLDENTDYYLSAAFDINDDVRFYVVDLDEGSVQTSKVAHELNQLHEDPYFQIGAPYPQLSLDGLVDEVRLSHGVVPIEKLLVNLTIGDFNQDGLLNVPDIDLLMDEVGSGGDGATFDLNGDGRVNDADRDEWLAIAGTANGLSAPYLVGDANLDTRVNVNDLNALAVQWLSSQNVWSDGNFTGGGVNSTDLNELALNWQRSVPMASATDSPVPEPSTFLLMVMGLAVCCRQFEVRK